MDFETPSSKGRERMGAPGNEAQGESCHVQTYFKPSSPSYCWITW